MTTPDTPPAPSRPDDAFFTLTDAVLFFLRHWLLIFGLAILAGGATAVYLKLQPLSYESAATLVVLNTADDENKDGTSSGGIAVQGYQKILDSDSLVAEAKARLVKKGILKADDELIAGQNVQSRVLADPAVKSSAVLQAVAISGDAEVAATVANTWVEVFMERIRAIRIETLKGSKSFATRLPQIQDDLTKLQKRRVESARDFATRNETAQTKWKEEILVARRKSGEAIAKHQKESLDALGAHLAETVARVEAFKVERQIEARKASLSALRSALLGVSDDAPTERPTLQGLLEELAPAGRKVADNGTGTTPNGNTDGRSRERTKGARDSREFAKEPGESQDGNARDRMPELKSMATPPVGAPATLPTLSSKDSVVLPVSKRTDLSPDEIKTLTAALEAAATALSKDLAALRALEMARDAELQGIRQVRRAGLEQLQFEAEQEYQALVFRRDTELVALETEQESALSQIDTQVKSTTSLFETVNKSANKAALANLHEDVPDVQIAAPAFAPPKPMARSITKYSLAATVVGAALAFLLALVMDVARAAKKR